jgi:hypothetical protein
LRFTSGYVVRYVQVGATARGGRGMVGGVCAILHTLYAVEYAREVVGRILIVLLGVVVVVVRDVVVVSGINQWWYADTL